MMISTTEVALSIFAFLGTIGLGIIGYFLRRTMDELDKTKDLAIQTKSELEVLKTDHNNKHSYISEKFDDLKDSIITLTKEIKELTSKIKD